MVVLRRWSLDQQLQPHQELVRNVVPESGTLGLRPGSLSLQALKMFHVWELLQTKPHVSSFIVPPRRCKQGLVLQEVFFFHFKTFILAQISRRHFLDAGLC